MIGAQLEIQLIAAVTAAACAIPGVFLLLRRMSMMSDVISHAILPGIVVAFFVTEDLASPYLILGAAVTGVITVALVELVQRTRLVKEDAAMGLVFPVLFSIGVILISRYAGNVHLDLDSVLLGELAFAPFNRMTIGGVDVGPQALWVMGVILILNLVFILVLYKELKIATFDAALAATLGFMPTLIHYILMSLVSVTAVGAFDAVGSILVVALFVIPPACAYLLTDRLNIMLLLSVALGVAAGVLGYWVAHWLDTSIAGSIALAAGLLFGIIHLMAPERGLIANWLRRRRQKWEFAERMLLIHLLNHEGEPDQEEESRISHLQEHLNWPPAFADNVVKGVLQGGAAREAGGVLHLTTAGRTEAKEVVAETSV